MAKRFTIAETEGRRRSHSYLVGDDVPTGSWTDDQDYPDELIGELEALGGSDSAPMFCFEPDGDLVVTVEELS